MLLQRRHSHWLYLLAAFLLSMQSLAIWHDVQHPFHHADSQCERYEAFAHTPALDIVNSVPTIYVSRFLVEVTPSTTTAVINRQYEKYAIRAPPLAIS